MPPFKPEKKFNSLQDLGEIDTGVINISSPQTDEESTKNTKWEYTDKEKYKKEKAEKNKKKEEETEKAVDKLLDGIKKHLIEKNKKNTMSKENIKPKENEPKNEMPIVKLADGQNKELKIGDEFYKGNQRYQIIGTRIAAKNNNFLLQAKINKEDKDEKPIEITPKEFTANFNKGEFSLPFSEDKSTKGEYQEKIDEIAEILKNNRIDQIIVGGENIKIKNEKTGEEEPALALKPDLDAKTALMLLNDYNKNSENKTYKRGAVTSFVGKDNSGQDKIEDKKGVKIFIDAGGSWMKVEKNTIYIDHHGEGRKDPTSGAKMVYEIMQKAGLLKSDSEKLKNFVSFVTEVDNLSYLEKKENDKKTFTKEYFKETWPKTFYAFAEKIPFEVLKKLYDEGKINDFSTPLTDEQLSGEIGNIEAGKINLMMAANNNSKEIQKIVATIKEKLFADGKIKDAKIITKEELQQLGKKIEIPMTIKNWTSFMSGVANKTIKGLVDADNYAKQENINTRNTILGKVYYHPAKTENSHPNYKNFIENNSVAFVGTKALGYDTWISWNKDPKKEQSNWKFYINSNHPKLSEVAKNLNEKFPNCAIEVRGTFIFGKIPAEMTEQDFLNAIDPKILANVKEGVVDNVPITKTSKEPEKTEPNQEELEAKMKKEQEIEADKKRLLEIDARLKEIREQKTASDERLAEIRARLSEIKKLKGETTQTDIASEEEMAETPTINVEAKKEEVKQQTENKETFETKTYSTEYIEKKINNLLMQIKAIKEILNLEVVGNNENIEIKSKLKAKKMFTVLVEFKANIKNENGQIVLKNHKIEAGALTSFVESIVAPKLKEISFLLKDFIEKEENKKVDSVQIKDGKLEVVFRK